MKTTFSRTFSTLIIVLMVALVLVGISFQALVKDYLTDNTFSSLQKDADVISNLATAYSMEGSLSTRNFVLNLNIASQISEADAVICDSSGKIVICSDSPMGCEHQGWDIDDAYFNKVIQGGGDQALQPVEDVQEAVVFRVVDEAVRRDDQQLVKIRAETLDLDQQLQDRLRQGQQLDLRQQIVGDAALELEVPVA